MAMALGSDRSSRWCQRPRRTSSATFAGLLAVVALAVCWPVAFLSHQLHFARRALTARHARGGEGRAISGEVTPLGGHLLVRLGKPETKTQGGIVLPSRQRPNEADVVSVGPGEVRSEKTGEVMPVGVPAGKRILYRPSAMFTKFELEGVEHALLREDDVVLSFDAPPEGEPAGPPAAGDASLGAARGRALVRVEEQKRETDEGILLSKGAAEEGGRGSITMGTVLAVGESNVPGEKPELAPGDRVYFKYGEEVKLRAESGKSSSEKYMSIRLSDCVAKASA